MKEKDLLNEPHYAIMEFESRTHQDDDGYPHYWDEVYYAPYKTITELTAALENRFTSGNKKSYRVVMITPMDVSIAVTATVQPGSQLDR